MASPAPPAAEPPPTLAALLAQSAGMQGHHNTRTAQCCCGRPESACAFLQHNNAALESLERDLRSAAQIGQLHRVEEERMGGLTFALQALLTRHEAYMAEAAAERARMEGTIGRLERDKKDLETANSQIISENRALLDQLEDLNAQAADADAHTRSLAATLQSTNAELQKLHALAGRAASLEAQIAAFELEGAQLRADLATSRESAQSAAQRWKRAEGTVGYLQEQVDRIEREAAEERARHVEIVGRMERRRTVERELEHAAGRLKGAAASKSLHPNSTAPGTNVVSHFVRDILQDNANLQLGIVELREMLLGSNAEVENLREQVLLHQPLPEEQDLRQSSLHAELESAEAQESAPPAEPAPEPAPELHVHHHYHAPKQRVQKARRKRPSLAAGPFRSISSSSGASTPTNRRRIHEWQEETTPTTTAAGAILAQTAATVPKRWSLQSAQSGATPAPSTVPSSPWQASTVFDHHSLDAALDDASRPTTPGSAGFSLAGSPPDFGLGRSLPTMRSVSSPAVKRTGLPPPPLTLQTKPDPSAGERPGQGSRAQSAGAVGSAKSLLAPRASRMSSSELASPLGHEIIFEEADDDGGAAVAHAPVFSDAPSPSDEPTRSATPSPSLHRARSSDSLLSIAGMDIHATLQPKTSQVFRGRGFAPTALASSPSAAPSPATAIFAPTATDVARPALTPGVAARAPPLTLPRLRHQSSGEYTRALLARQRAAAPRPSLGRAVGGWVRSKWGIPSPPTPATPATPATPQTPPTPGVATLLARAPGVNQSGAIRGLRAPLPAPVSVEPERVDEEALRESLAEG